MVTVPPATPDTTPVPLTTVATLELLLVQAPPVEASLSVIDDPHIVVEPLIAAGVLFTDTVVVAAVPQPFV